MYREMIRARDLNAGIDRACHNIITLEDEANTDTRKAELEAFGAVKIMIEELQKKGEITYV